MIIEISTKDIAKLVASYLQTPVTSILLDNIEDELRVMDLYPSVQIVDFNA